eukprot:7043545-Pyramimonas_sp.AAC.1
MDQLVRLEDPFPDQPADYHIPNSDEGSESSTEPVGHSSERKLTALSRRRRRMIAKSAVSRRPGE